MDAGLDDRTLRRIMAMLVSFAVLAEHTAGRSFPVRWLVLTLARYAEAVILDLVSDWVLVDFAGLDDDPPGHEPCDATLLGWRLRTLAALFGSLLAPTRHPRDRTIDLDGWPAVADAAPLGRAPRADCFFVIVNGRRPAFRDTS